MYKIYADDELIFDSTLEDYKIGTGQITKETNKSGSFVFSLYPDHPFYDGFVKMKTVVTVYKDNQITFRGRVLSDEVDYWNHKVLTCGGELDFLQDSIVRPYTFTGTPQALFEKFIEEHNAQVDDFKKFRVGTCTVVDANSYIARENEGYESTLANMTSRLLEDSTGGHFYITHGDDGREEVPTIHYLAEFNTTASQAIEFGSNLKNYAKKAGAEDIATALIPLGTETRTIVETEKDEDTGETITTTRVEETGNPLTIASVNGGEDYVYSPEAVALYGWIFTVITWEDITVAANLKTKALAYLADLAVQNVTLELNAIDLHLLDRNIESFNVCDRVRVTSAPHGVDTVLLCNKQTLDLLKPENDTVVLGHTYYTFTEKSNKAAAAATGAGGASVALIKQALAAGSQNSADIVNIVARLDALEEGKVGTNTVAITADNIEQYFIVTNGNYYFAGEGTRFATNNGGVSGSTAQTTLMARFDMDVSFVYSYASEASYDKFTLQVGATVVENAASGAYTLKQYSGTIAAGTAITFTYTKDSSNDKNGDQCTFSNMAVIGEFTGA